MTITTSGPEETTKTRQTVPRIALANPKPIEDVGLTLVQQLVSFKHKSSMHPLGPGGAKRPKPKTPRPKHSGPWILPTRTAKQVTAEPHASIPNPDWLDLVSLSFWTIGVASHRAVFLNCNQQWRLIVPNQNLILCKQLWRCNPTKIQSADPKLLFFRRIGLASLIT